MTRWVLPLCTEMTDRDNADVPITQGTNIVDVSGVSLRQFWNLKSHMQAASTLATAHYPETLDRIFVSLDPLHDVFLLTPADYRRTFLLFHCLGMDQAVV
jgi:hypothetical protein